MSRLLTTIREILRYALLLIIGLYAGMHFFHEMCPVETQLTPLEYARYWKIVDGTFMHRRMGVMGPLMMGLFVVNVVFNLKNWKSPGFLLLLLSFVAFGLDVAFTVREQLPINEFINGLDLKHLTPTKMAALARAQNAAIANFQSRFLLSIFSYASLCLALFSKKIANQTVV